MKTKAIIALALLTAFYLLAPPVASAYVGPGSGLTVIGAALAFLGSIVLAIIGFVWYPVKRLLRRFRGRTRTGNPANTLSR
jgi:hypothetical protein